MLTKEEHETTQMNHHQTELPNTDQIMWNKAGVRRCMAGATGLHITL
jgi:hypothetical protein